MLFFLKHVNNYVGFNWKSKLLESFAFFIMEEEFNWTEVFKNVVKQKLSLSNW